MDYLLDAVPWASRLGQCHAVGCHSVEHVLSDDFLSFRMALMALSFPQIDPLRVHIYSSSEVSCKYGHWKTSVHLVCYRKGASFGTTNRNKKATKDKGKSEALVSTVGSAVEVKSNTRYASMDCQMVLLETDSSKIALTFNHRVGCKQHCFLCNDLKHMWPLIRRQQHGQI